MYRATIVASGTTYRARTPQGVVAAMKRDAWQSGPGKGRYMKQVQDRVEQMTRVRVPIHSCEAFLRGLVDAGLITYQIEQ